MMKVRAGMCGSSLQALGSMGMRLAGVAGRLMFSLTQDISMKRGNRWLKMKVSTAVTVGSRGQALGSMGRVGASWCGW
jgi:hypothetical protein